MSFEMKSVAGRNVLFVMAADPEYGVFLRTRISPLMTGIGPVEAAVVLTRELTRLAVQDDLPDLVVSLGSAGSAKLEQTEVYQVSAVSYRDMDASAFGFEKGRTPLLDLPAVVELPLRIPGIPVATLSTGANVVSGAAYQAVEADMVDMETFAVLRACHAFDLPLIGLRGISDGRHDVNHIDDWTQYLHVIDKKLALAVDGLQTALEDGVFWF
ncbi:5'-methylthioadenosine nucleosidase [Rhizobium sp. Root274]|uniref:5'-methylthioadenosine/S-adenosylhomocysteine nucleosidase n=1 Tax=unclassified Rhizobium TaxID=2613769 RepID=UPI000713DD03|nr:MULTISPECIES: 5'-methylthioadenosine/S-adenosylhomocysteine nucleosidase [unclassified Rhizobium]KQW31992.1 5'-methylthioadenosine nucleosidase [Rhizobium sp. Root1240]KRD33530.1 5'-methylthioadenosine nucleosidase [Rhizobium sp. Root274]